MTLKKAYIYMTLSILLIVLSIILFVFNFSSNYIFWYHTVFYIAASITVLVSVLAIILNKKHNTKNKILDMLDWLSFTTQSMSFILLIFMFFLFSSTVQQSSMYPTLEEGNVIIASHFNYDPTRGDIVIIHVDPEKHPGETEKLLVKRIAAMPGDLVEFIASPIDDGYKIVINGSDYIVNGVTYIARYVSSEKAVIEASLDVTGHVKDNEYLVFGDNEPHSKDSRNLGTFETEDIIGHVIYRMWPFGGLS